MSADYAIEVRNVAKCFRLAPRGGRTLKSLVVDRVQNWRQWRRRREFWALRDVDFEVARGETLGIIGSNGAGKSTLLALLAGTMTPTAGSVVCRGTVSSLLELGAGFHPDLTGRENVYLWGAILGLPREWMRRRFDAIVAFAELAEFIDQPVKHYSSGMYVRLGFAVAVEVNPDILIVDEVLAVGDAVFQRKCLERMTQFRRDGKTLLVVSHDLQTIRSVSDRILLLDGGRITGLGRPESVLHTYERHWRKQFCAEQAREWGSGEASIEDVAFLDATGQPVDSLPAGRELRVRLTLRAAVAIPRPVIGFSIADIDGRVLHGSNTQMAGRILDQLAAGRTTIDLVLRRINLGAARYLFSFSVHSEDHRKQYHRVDNAFPLTIENPGVFEGPVPMESHWEWSTGRLP